METCFQKLQKYFSHGERDILIGKYFHWIWIAKHILKCIILFQIEVLFFSIVWVCCFLA